MELSPLDAFLWGCVGGVLPDVIRLVKGRYELNLPKYLSSGAFWLGFVFMVALGGFTAWLSHPITLKGALAFGFAAPEVLSGFLAQRRNYGAPPRAESKNMPRLEATRSGRMDVVRGWWAA